DEIANGILSVDINRTADNVHISPQHLLQVGENDSFTGTGTTINPVVGQSFNGTEATFTDTDTITAASDLHATINWGDGNTTAGVVTGGAGNFSVAGTHTYSSAGSDPITVTLFDNAPGTASATANSTANVAAVNLVGQVTLTAATEHVALPANTVVATFT